MGKIYIMMGLPAAGKSTFLKKYAEPLDNAEIVSRDKIRFSLLKEGEEYFSHEEEVKKILWETINNALDKGKDVYIDQTSLNKASRKLLIDHINKDVEINIIFVITPLLHCLVNNESRAGTKAYVPKGVIKRMNSQMESPEYSEGFKHIYIYDIFTDKVILVSNWDKD